MLVLSRPFTIASQPGPSAPVAPASGPAVGTSPSGVTYGGQSPSAGMYSIAQRFTTSAPISVDAILADFTGNYRPGNLEMGIASDIGTNPSQVAWVNDGTNLLKTAPFVPNVGSASFPLPARLLLPAGTYWLVARGDSDNGAADLRSAIGTGSRTGVVSAVDLASTMVVPRANPTGGWTTHQSVVNRTADAVLWQLTHT